MQLNASKTQAIIFRRNFDSSTPPSSVLGENITYRPKMKYLGVLLDSKLYFDHHMQERVTKSLQRLNTIRRLTRVHWGAQPGIIRRLFLQCVQPMILYASPIWAHRVRILSDQKALDRTTRHAGIAIGGVLATASLEAVTQLAHLHPLSDLAMWTLVIHAASSTALAEDFNRSSSGGGEFLFYMVRS